MLLHYKNKNIIYYAVWDIPGKTLSFSIITLQYPGVYSLFRTLDKGGGAEAMFDAVVRGVFRTLDKGWGGGRSVV